MQLFVSLLLANVYKLKTNYRRNLKKGKVTSKIGRQLTEQRYASNMLRVTAYHVLQAIINQVHMHRCTFTCKDRDIKERGPLRCCKPMHLCDCPTSNYTRKESESNLQERVPTQDEKRPLFQMLQAIASRVHLYAFNSSLKLKM